MSYANPSPRRAIIVIAAALLLGAPSLASAAEGEIEISQVAASVGGVTPGDAPGFPVTLSVSGAYRLTSGLVVPDVDTTAISITASDVTLDLNGFTIQGPVTCTSSGVCTPPVLTGTGDGVSSTESRIVVRNGIITGMGQHGIDLDGGSTQIERVIVDQNAFMGIRLDATTAGTQDGGSVSNSIVTQNGNAGIVCAECRVAGNVVRGNASSGILPSRGTAIGNLVQSNGGGIGSNALGGFGIIVVENVVVDNGGGLGTGFNDAYGLDVVQGNGGVAQVPDGVSIGASLCGSTTAACP